MPGNKEKVRRKRKLFRYFSNKKHVKINKRLPMKNHHAVPYLYELFSNSFYIITLSKNSQIFFNNFL